MEFTLLESEYASSESSVEDEHELHENTPTQRSRSPSPELSFKPLAPPPWHAKSRKRDAIIGPDDPRSYDVDLCRYVLHILFTAA